jgi:hypothetical protein
MTKKELIKTLSTFNDDDVVIISFGDGWSNIETIEQHGSCINIKAELYPLFSEN